MKGAIKRTAALVLSFVLIMTTMLSFNLSVISAADSSGDCGTNAKWSYDAATKTLTISGSGATYDFRATNILTNKKAPWEDKKEEIKNIVIDQGITEIGEYCFYNCTAVTSVSLPSTLTTICGSGIGTDISSASYGAFQGCTSLQSITLPEGLKTIEPYAFKNCTALKSITFPNSMTSLGKCAFLSCSALETVNFGQGLTDTGAYTFDSAGVKRINWGSITNISERAFYNSGLKDLELPETIKSVGTRAFSNSTNLMNVTVNNANTTFSGTNNKTSNAFSGSSQSVTIYGHSGSTAQTFAENCGYTFVSIDDCDHLDTRIEIVNEASCTEDGLQQEICNTCGAIVSETTISAYGHDWTLAEENDSTELDGHIYRYYECSNCSETKEEVEHQRDSSLGYIWVEGYYTYSYTREPTCTSPGLATYTCTIEGCTNLLGRPTSESRVVPAGHKVDSWTQTPATCTEAGSEVGVCTECGETVTKTTAALGHLYTEDDKINSVDNKEDGHTHNYYKCQRCSDTVEELVHNDWIYELYTRDTIIKPTCTRTGIMRDTCILCGETRNVTIQPTGEHDYQETERKDPDCTTRGTISYKCANCDQTKTEYVSALGHSYVLDEENSIPATCTANGTNKYTCSRCSMTKQETVMATGHTPKEGTYEIIDDPSCTAPGKAVAVCDVCAEPYEETVDALGHEYVDVETDLTDEGKPGHVLVVPTCKRCGDTQAGQTRHKEWIEGYYETTDGRIATCNRGYTTDTCTVKGCGETRINQIPGLGHMYFYTGTQTADGVTLFCPYCLTSTVIPASTLLEYWGNGEFINCVPNRTETDVSGHLDLNRSGLVNGKDFAMILKLVQQEEKLIAERDSAVEENGEAEEQTKEEAAPVDPENNANEAVEKTEE